MAERKHETSLSSNLTLNGGNRTVFRSLCFVFQLKSPLNDIPDLLLYLLRHFGTKRTELMWSSLM